MDRDVFSSICSSCGGLCCKDARPPLTEMREKILVAAGLSRDDVEFAGYRRIKARDNGYCVLFENGRCKLHQVKPETCVAGPFTFDIRNGKLEIYLKRESICPLAGYLLRNSEAYDKMLEVAIPRILDLIDGLNAEELDVILKIEEPETFKVMEIDLNDRHRA